MVQLSSDIISFFKKQGYVIVSTLDPQGKIHCAAKGIVGIEKRGIVYLMDLFRKNTFTNLTRNATVSITAVDEHQFMGYTLKGKAKIVDRDKIEDHLIKTWEDRVVQRVSSRLIKNLKEDKKTAHHPESLFPHPQYLIEVDVEEIVDLTPGCLKLITKKIQ